MSTSIDHILDLGLGLTKTTTTTTHNNHLKKQPPTYFEPSLTLSLSGETLAHINAAPSYGLNNCKTEEATTNYNYCSNQASPRYCNSTSVASSLSNNYVTVKRERDTTVAPALSEEVEAEKIMSRGGSDGEEDEGNTRKKLRLTKDQSALLEESFKQQSTLNPKQKQALANRLNLRTRQVEVWFQNRRARTKLKQTELDYEFLKKCCENLTDENRRLQKELQELKSLKLTNPFYTMQLPAATSLSMCPSCERIGSGVVSNNNTHGGPVGGMISGANGNSNMTFAAKSHHQHQFYNSYTNPSAAC